MQGTAGATGEACDADVVKLLSCTGRSVLVVRLWRGPCPYLARSTVATVLTTATDKRLRAAAARALAEEEELQQVGALPCSNGSN